MIIIGYQGIGKTTLAQRSKDYIDLESSCFFNRGYRPNNWYVFYCNIADHLSKQGYRVFVSSHAEVRNRLRKHSTEEIFSIVPAEELEEQWKEKLYDRWIETRYKKDFKAYLNASDRYLENIREIKKDFLYAQIDTMDYDLEQVIEVFFNDVQRSC